MQIVAVHLNNVYRMQGYSKTSMVNLCIKKQNYINIAEILEGEGQGINHMWLAKLPGARQRGK